MREHRFGKKEFYSSFSKHGLSRLGGIMEIFLLSPER
jgi:hypothetical protein